MRGSGGRGIRDSRSASVGITVVTARASGATTAAARAGVAGTSITSRPPSSMNSPITPIARKM